MAVAQARLLWARATDDWVCADAGRRTDRLRCGGERASCGAPGVVGVPSGRGLAFRAVRRFVENLAASHTVVRYDRLGTGVSDRERPPETFTPEFEVAAMCAVLDELELDRVAVMGISCGGCTGVSFAASWPERVERLVLYGSYADGHALGPPKARTGMVDLVRSHWGLGSRLLADVLGPSWSLEDRVEGLFAQYPVELTFERYALDFEADSAAAFVDTLADFYGPLLQARNKLTDTGRWEPLRDELIALSNEMDAGSDGHFSAPSEYLVTVARKRN